MSTPAKTEIRRVRDADKNFWYSLDGHLPQTEFDKKVRDGQGYVLSADGRPAGILRYNLLWDETPFCTLLYIAEGFRRKRFGKTLMEFWENEMRSRGYGLVMVSTRADENAQHFYRAIGYTDCGSLKLTDRPAELFFCKRLP